MPIWPNLRQNLGSLTKNKVSPEVVEIWDLWTVVAAPKWCIALTVTNSAQVVHRSVSHKQGSGEFSVPLCFGLYLVFVSSINNPSLSSFDDMIGCQRLWGYLLSHNDC